MRQIAEKTAAIGGTRTAIEYRFRGVEQAWRADRQNALVRSFLSAIRGVDSSAQPGFLLKSGTSDMNVVAPVWRCPILAYGPGDSALDHTPNEHLPLDEYWRAVQVVERALREYARE
jgi:[amino group carrier protein]-lysine/ornithine hydrolase